MQAESCLGEAEKLQQVLKDGAAEYKDAVAKGREVDGLLEDNARLRKKADVSLLKGIRRKEVLHCT